MSKTNNTETTFYPGWKQAAFDIVSMVESNGYGFTISHDELLNMLELEKLTGLVTPQKCEEFSLKRLSYTESLKDVLLKEHNIYLSSVRGEGYQILFPDDQVKFGPAKHLKRAAKEISKAIQTLSNVNVGLLSDDGKRIQERGLARTAFIKATFNQKKIPQISEVKKISKKE